MWVHDSFWTGWSGSGGLGAKEQGIQDPIKGGDIRDKWDQYKGVGVSLDDPYENYRRNKSYNFVARMKAREEGTSPSGRSLFFDFWKTVKLIYLILIDLHPSNQFIELYLE